MSALRLIAALAACGWMACASCSALLADPAAAVKPRPTAASTGKKAPHHAKKRAPTPGTAQPVAPVAPVPAFAAVPPHVITPPAVGHAIAHLAVATGPAASALDMAAVKTAIELVRKSRQAEATATENNIADPLARKLVEWIVLRGDNNETVDFARYANFIAGNPSWPGIVTLRRHAEAALWQQQVDPQTAIEFLAANPPLSAKGYFALARAWITRGDAGKARAALRTAWRDTGFSEELESQAREIFAGLITPVDDKARMDKRFYLEDADAGLRAARHLDANQQAIAKAFAAVLARTRVAKALLDAVPAAAQRDPAYIYSRIRWLRHADKIKEAAQLLLVAPRDPAVLVDPDQWWVERRLIARKLLDLGDFLTAYKIASEAAVPSTENHRTEQQFTAGWIALRFLHQGGPALAHFAHIADGIANPITLARAYYWQGRAAAALGREQEARNHFQIAARFPTAYYGQLARAQLHLDDMALRDLPQPPIERRQLELGRAFEILYAIDERDLVAVMAADIADKATDVPGLTALAEIAARHNDARATLLIGKAALGRGMPFERYAFPDFGVPDYQQIGPRVERCVVYSIVRQESAFNPKVISSAHALGLMQVTPAAGRNTAKKFKVPFDQRRLLSDVVYNAQLGTAELGDNINDYRGSYVLAFASYNAGRRRVSEWIEKYGDPRDRRVDPVDWIERIPFSETRNYVERVIENMQVYRARLENNPKLLIEADLRRGG